MLNEQTMPMKRDSMGGKDKRKSQGDMHDKCALILCVLKKIQSHIWNAYVINEIIPIIMEKDNHGQACERLNK